MKKGKFQDYKKISNATFVLVTLLLLAFYVVTICFCLQIYDQVISIKEHPFAVITASSNVKTSVAQMRMLTERLCVAHTEEAIGKIKSYSSEIEGSCGEAVQIIVEQCLVAPEEAREMQQIYYEILECKEKLLELYDQSLITGEEAKEYIQTNIEPRLDLMDTYLASITTNAENKFGVFVNQAKSYRNLIIILSTILIVGVFAALVIFKNILRKKEEKEEQLYSDMKVALGAAQAANKDKSHFLSNVFQDVIAPINTLASRTTIASNNLNNTDKLKECLCKANASTQELSRLVNNIFDMNSFENGKFVIKEEKFELQELMKMIMSIIKQKAEAKKLMMEISFSEVKDNVLIGDTVRLQQIFINLLENAVKFTPEGGKIELQVIQKPTLDKKYGNFEFVVSDTGIGMTKEFLVKIFDPFAKKVSLTLPVQEGAGLGMAITKNIVDMMGGHILVESEVGEGTVCRVRLPIKLQEKNMDTNNEE